MTPEQRAREVIDRKLLQSGWIIQDVKSLNPMAAMGVAVREFPTSTGEVDYALFVEGVPVGVVEAKPEKISPRWRSSPPGMQTALLSGSNANTASALLTKPPIS